MPVAWRKGEYAYGMDGGTPALHLGYIMIVFSVLDFFSEKEQKNRDKGLNWDISTSIQDASNMYPDFFSFILNVNSSDTCLDMVSNTYILSL